MGAPFLGTGGGELRDIETGPARKKGVRKCWDTQAKRLWQSNEKSKIHRQNVKTAWGGGGPASKADQGSQG